MTSGRDERRGRLRSPSRPCSAKQKTALKAGSSKQILALGYPPLRCPCVEGANERRGVSAPLVNAILVDPVSPVDLGLSPGSGLSDAS